MESWHGTSHVTFRILLEEREYWTDVEFFVARGE
jgi:hypothetical protein